MLVADHLSLECSTMLSLDKKTALWVSLLGIGVVFAVDVMTPPQLNLSFLYMPFLMLLTWHLRWRVGLLGALVAFAAQLQVVSVIGQTLSLGYVLVILANRVVMFLFAVGMTELLRNHVDRADDESSMDAVTVLPNVTWFERALEHQVSSGLRFGESFAVIQVDCDQLAAVSAEHGGDSANTLLHLVARTLERFSFARQNVARSGDSQFSILIPSESLDNVARQCKRLKAALDASVREAELQTSLRVSVVYVDGGAVSTERVIAECHSVRAAARLAAGNATIEMRRLQAYRGEVTSQQKFA
jgi:diguanylate cyclase (GGDEF)-like protein